MLLKKLTLIIIVGVLILVLVNQNIEKNPENITASYKSETEDIVSTPIPFEELTIPYLRNREYSSNLGNMEKVSENASYTSYLTTYSSDGLKVYGLLTHPVGNKPESGWPAVVFIQPVVR